MKERRFDVLKTYVKTSFFRAFMSKDEHNKNFFESVIINFITIFVDMYTEILYNQIHTKHTEIVWN